MLSYQHAYHAGGPADLHKHAAFAALLTLLTVKARPISVIESHAGRGLYDLASPETAKTGEAARGIARVTPADLAGPRHAEADREGADLASADLAGAGAFARALAAARARFGPEAYPGSPLIARALLRAGDRLTLCELHPAEHAALRTNLNAAVRNTPPGPRWAVHRRDGHEALPALVPPDPRRGLALLDPSYEVKTEYARTAETALTTLRRWPEGCALVWYPLIDDRHLALTEPLRAAHPDALIDEAAFADPPARGMHGSGLILLNPPWGADRALADTRAALAPILR